MDRKVILELLEKNEKRYNESHPYSGVDDIQIARSYWSGRPVTEIAMEASCSESTAYRAIRRVKAFLLQGEPYFETLRLFAKETPPNYGDGNANSILEMLFCRYEEFNRFDTEEIKKQFCQLYAQMNGLSIKQMDPVIDTTCTLCREHQKSGFVEGVKVGVRLGMEFYS